MRLAIVGLALMLSACATTPRETVAKLDPRDPRWDSRACEQARAEAQAFNDHKEGRVVIGVLGNLVVPFAGSAAAFAMDRMQADERKALSHKVKAACISDPLRGKKRRIASNP
jgi:hypothetical protein